MSLYVFRTDMCFVVEDWVKQTKRRSQEGNILKNPLFWKFKIFKKNEKLYCLVDARPVYFNFSWFGWISAVSIYFVWGWTPWILLFAFIGSLGVFWTSIPFILLNRLALRKHGYKGKYKVLSFASFIREVIL